MATIACGLHRLKDALNALNEFRWSTPNCKDETFKGYIWYNAKNIDSAFYLNHPFQRFAFDEKLINIFRNTVFQGKCTIPQTPQDWEFGDCENWKDADELAHSFYKFTTEVVNAILNCSIAESKSDEFKNLLRSYLD